MNEKIINTVTSHRSGAEKIIAEFPDVFDGLGCVEGEVSLEIDESIPPKQQIPRRVPQKLRAEMKKQLDEMEDMGVITKVNEYSEWTSNILIVRRNDKLRLCIVPVDLNKALLDVKYQIPKLEEILPELHQAKVFSCLDAKKGFWNLKLDEKSSKLTTFVTPFGNYRFLRMPFGIKPAMEIYQKRQHLLLQGLEGVVCIADDILVFGSGETMEEAIADHDINLKKLLIRIRKENLKLNRDKLRLCQDSVKFFGHIINSKGIMPDPDKVKAIREMPKPENKDDVLRFLGMVTYLSKFIPNLSEHSEPLRRLVTADQFDWNQDHQENFDNIKNLISSDILLGYYDVNKPLKIQTDSSSKAIGCTLMQEERPISYASRTLSTTEANYAQIEKECLAIVYACTKFDQYICGKCDITIETDHEPLVTIFKKPLFIAPRRIQKMLMVLQRYNFRLVYKKGTEMIIADTLSRAPTNTLDDPHSFEVYCMDFEKTDPTEDLRISSPTMEKLVRESETDEEIILLNSLISNGWPTKYSDVSNLAKRYFKFREQLTIYNGLVLKGDRILVPQVMRRFVLDTLHKSHQGIEATQKLSRECVY